MRKSKLILLALGFLFFECGQKQEEPLIELNSIFYKQEHKEIIGGIEIMDGKYCEVIGYDLNENGKIDAFAYYPRYFHFLKGIYFSDYAKKILEDRNEDGKWDYTWEDKNNNGTLESCEEFKEESNPKRTEYKL